MDCKYTLVNTGEEKTYQELKEILRNSNSLLNDILFSLDTNLLTRVIDLIELLKESGKRVGVSEFSSNNNFNEGAAEPSESRGVISALHFIDSGMYCNESGEQIMPTYDLNLLLEKKRIFYKDVKHLNDDDINLRLNAIATGYNKIAKDCCDLHKIILKFNKNQSYVRTEESVQGTSFDHLADVIHEDICNLVEEKVKIGNGRNSHIIGDSSSVKIIKNVNITALLNNSSDKIIQHIDYVAIRPDGSLDIYNIKGSHEPYEFWDSTKKEKYLHEFALLAKMLEYNGIPIKNIRFNIIPVILKYDDSMQNVDKIKVDKARCMSHNRNAFIMQDVIKQAGKFIESNVQNLEVTNENVNNVNRLLSSLFPDGSVYADGVVASIKDYIDNNWRYWLKGELPENGWKLTINGNAYFISDSNKGSKNKELIKLIERNKNELLSVNGGSYSASGIISQLRNFRRSSLGIPMFNDYYMNEFFEPYFEHTIPDENGKFKYIWEPVNNPVLDLCNVIAFLNIYSKLIDIISLSTLNLNKSFKINGFNNILGTHVSDTLARTEDGLMLLNCNYGNLELLRTMFLVNEIIPNLPDDALLGNVQVLGGIGGDLNSVIYPMELIFPHFLKAKTTIDKYEPSIRIDNNFSKTLFVNPSDLLINLFLDIIKDNPAIDVSEYENIKDLLIGSDEEKMLHLIDGSTRESLAAAELDEVKISRIQELINMLQTILENNYIKTNDEEIFRLSQEYNKSNPKTSDIIHASAKLLMEASIALNQFEGNVKLRSSSVSGLDSFMAMPQNQQDNQIRVISKLWSDAIHRILKRIDAPINKINLIFEDYYKKKGYGKVRNALISDLKHVFDHLYTEDKNDLIFKNPYIAQPGLDSDDVEFLKKILFEFAKIKYTEEEFPYTSYNDPRIETFIENRNKNDYFWAPLEKASTSTMLSDPMKAMEELKRRTDDYLHDPKRFFKEFYENITKEEEEYLNQDILNMLAYNPFRRSMTTKGRQNLIGEGEAAKDKSFWESNILNLYIDYVFKTIRAQEMNRMTVRARGIMLQLRLTGTKEGDPKKYALQIKQIDEYITTAVFNLSTMSQFGKDVVSKIAPARRAFSYANIAGNVAGSVRDLVGGLRSNLVRAITKYQTDISAVDVIWAYNKVVREGPHSALVGNLLDKFNTKYLISNINRENLLQGYKTNRGGITNPGEIAYATMKYPDYINRMVLFLAKLHHDGSFNAYSIDEKTGELKYEWRLDKRFDLLAANDKSNPEKYNKQLSLYLSQLMEFNKEDPDLNLEIKLGTDLPDGYTLNLIEQIKLLGNTIYGSYDNGTKAPYEQTAVGSQIGFLTTWMNGIYDAYLGKRRESSFETEKQQKTRNGVPLFLKKNDDGTYDLTEEDTGIKAVEDVPIVVQGILRTIGDIFNEIYYGRGIDGLKKNIWKDPLQRRNLKRLIADLIVWFITGMIISKIVKPGYKEHLQTSLGTDILPNVMKEVAYKGYIASNEENKALWPIVDYAINDTSATAAKWGSNSLLLCGKAVFGDKHLSDVVFNSSALARNMRDSYKLYKKDTANGLTVE